MISLQITHSVCADLSAYCFGRVLAAQFGFRFSAPQFRGVLQDEGVAGDCFLGAGVGWSGQWPFETLSGRRVEVGELRVAPGRGVVLKGDFQRFDLIADAREEIRGDWCKLSGALPVREVGDFAIGLRFRPRHHGKQGASLEERAISTGSVMKEAEVRRLVGVVAHGRLYFVTDEPLHPFFERVRDLGGEVLGVESEAEELRLIHSFQKVAISQDALQWWGAFLGAAREIYFPQIERGIWSHPAPALLAHDPWWHGIDLRVPNDERYVYDW